MKVVVDKFANSYAVVSLSDQTYALMPKKLLEDAHEGDVVEIKVDEEESKTRREMKMNS